MSITRLKWNRSGSENGEKQKRWSVSSPEEEKCKINEMGALNTVMRYPGEHKDDKSRQAEGGDDNQAIKGAVG